MANALFLQKHSDAETTTISTRGTTFAFSDAWNKDRVIPTELKFPKASFDIYLGTSQLLRPLPKDIWVLSVCWQIIAEVKLS